MRHELIECMRCVLIEYVYLQAQYKDDWQGSMRAIRDADISMPTQEFQAFITEVHVHIHTYIHAFVHRHTHIDMYLFLAAVVL